MRIIYSNKLIEGLNGLYKNPQFFEKPEINATEVYTNDERIYEAYSKLKNVKIFRLNGKPYKTKQKGGRDGSTN